MNIKDAKASFVQSWGSYGSNWGINRTMAQIHALLLISDRLYSTEEIMEELVISRGNVNMNIRSLIEWGLVYKEYVSGERKEFFRGEKDIWTAAKKIMLMRKQRELNPVIELMEELKAVESSSDDKEEVRNFRNKIKEIHDFANQAEKLFAFVAKEDKTWFWKKFMKFFK